MAGALGRARTSGVGAPFNSRFLEMKKITRDPKRGRSMRTLNASFESISCDSPMSVRGQKTEVSGLARHVRFTLRSRHRQPAPACPFGVESRCDAVALGSNISVAAP